MPSCRDIEPLLTALIDEQATATERAALDAHLRECGLCRRRASAQAATRRLLRERAGALHVEAPPGLRAKCQPPARAFMPFVRPVRLWAVAAVLVAVFAIVFYGATHGSTVLAAELTLDHLKCFTLLEKASGPSDAARIAERLDRSYGLTIRVPATSVALGLQLVGGRRCFSTDGRVAHILYRHAGRPLSLFVVPNDTRTAQQLAVIGHQAVIWSHRGTSYVVLAREPRPQLMRVAEYVKSVVE